MINSSFSLSSETKTTTKKFALTAIDSHMSLRGYFSFKLCRIYPQFPGKGNHYDPCVFKRAHVVNIIS